MIYDLGDIVDFTNDGDEENGSEEKKAELLQVAMLENEKKEVGANDQINDNTTTNNNMTMNLQTTSNQPTPKLLTPKPPPSPFPSPPPKPASTSIWPGFPESLQPVRPPVFPVELDTNSPLLP